MFTSLASIRNNLQAQGFCGLDDRTYAQINYPLRLAPALCMLWAAVGTVLASPTILWALAPLAALGAVLRGHPFDVLYNYGLRHLTGAPPLPSYGGRRRIACAFATALIVTAAWCVQAGMPIAGQIAGWALVAGTFLNVSTGICGPAVIARIFLGKVVCM